MEPRGGGRWSPCQAREVKLSVVRVLPQGGVMVASVSVATKFNVGGILLDRPFKIRRLGQLGFNVTNLEQEHHFYSDLLGFRVSDEFARGGLFMRFGPDHHAFALFQKPAAQPPATPGPGERRYARPAITIHQITWQTPTLSET